MSAYRDTMTAYICGQLLIATGKEPTGRVLKYGLPPAIAAGVAGLPEHLHIYVQVMWVYYLHPSFVEAMENQLKDLAPVARQIYSLARRADGEDKMGPLTRFAYHWVKHFNRGTDMKRDYSTGPKNFSPEVLLERLASIGRWCIERAGGWVEEWPALRAEVEASILTNIEILTSRRSEREEVLYSYITDHILMIEQRPEVRARIQGAFEEYMATEPWVRRWTVRDLVEGGLYRLAICAHLGA